MQCFFRFTILFGTHLRPFVNFIHEAAEKRRKKIIKFHARALIEIIDHCTIALKISHAAQLNISIINRVK